jgi:hypothetical protein
VTRAYFYEGCSRIALGIRRRRRRSQGKSASAPSSSVRRRAIPDARSLFCEGCSRIALCLIARSARCDVRWVAAVFVGADGTEKRVPPSPPSDRRREHRESAVVVVARRGKNASAPSSSVRLRAIPDARSLHSASTKT